jgi:hypothetical protein
MTAPIPRDQVQMTLRIMASQARDAREAYRRELAACREKNLIKDRPYSVPNSLTERQAHWNMAQLMLHTAVTHLLFSGRNTRRVDQYVADLIGGEHWPTETGPATDEDRDDIADDAALSRIESSACDH